MRSGTLLDRPFVRGALVLVAAVASVATSAPSWGLDAEAGVRRTNIGPGATVHRVVSSEASHTVTMRSWLPTVTTSPGAKITFTLRATDATEDVCPPSVATFTPSTKWENRWVETSPRTAAAVDAGSAADAGAAADAGVSSYETWDMPGVRVICGDGGKHHAYRATITNEGPTALDVDWQITATIGEDGRDSTPDGAFVNARDENP